MIAKLEMPLVDRALQRGVLVRWFKAEGDAVTYGDDMCEVAVDEILVLKKRKDARILAANPATVASREAIGEGHRIRSRKKVPIRLRLTSSDTGFLRRILVREQDRVEIGDLLAILSTTADEPVDATGAFSFRVVANRVEEEGGPWH